MSRSRPADYENVSEQQETLGSRHGPMPPFLHRRQAAAETQWPLEPVAGQAADGASDGMAYASMDSTYSFDWQEPWASYEASASCYDQMSRG